MMVSGVGEVFCNCTFLVTLAVSTIVLANVRLPGDKMTGRVPVPLNGELCGLFDALSFTVNVPLSAPVTGGLNVTEIVQLDFAAMVLGNIGQLDVCAKSLEVEISEIVSGVVWLFTSKAVFVALVVFTA